jgi:hypothetical protein
LNLSNIALPLMPSKWVRCHTVGFFLGLVASRSVPAQESTVVLHTGLQPLQLDVMK